MPRKVHNPVDDPEITIRFKHGIHTIFLFAMVDWSFSRLTSELLAILRDRYPAGLTTSIDQPEGTAVPSSDDDVKLAYAVPKNPGDFSQGWKNIKVRPDDTVGSKGLKDNCSLAFAVLEPDADEGSVKFQVELPAVEEDEEM